MIHLSASAMVSKSIGVAIPNRSHRSILQRWMTIDRTMGPKGADEGDATAIDRNTVVKHDDQFWRVVAAFSKYYGRWSCVGAPVTLVPSVRLMLQAVDKKTNPILQDNFERTPWITVVLASECEDTGYTVMKEEDYTYKQKKRKLTDMWA